MANAKQFLGERYDSDDQLLLRDHDLVLRAWSGSAWPEVPDRRLTSEVYHFLDGAEFVVQRNRKAFFREFHPNKSSVAEIVAAVRAIVYTASDGSMPFWLDGSLVDAETGPETAILPMANGLLDTSRRVLLPVTPNFFCPYALPYRFDEHVPEPTRFLSFLDELWPDDGESQRLLQEFIGYTLVPNTSYQKMLLLVGPPRSGKGVIGRLVRSLVGHSNVAGLTLASLSTNFGLWPLIDKPVAIIPDARLTGRRASGAVVERLLSITGEDALTVDRKYKRAWTGILPTRLIVLTNELPRLGDASGALASRFLVLTLTESFLGREDLQLDAQLQQELPGILLWALDGLKRLQSRGHFVEPASSRTMVEQLSDLSSPIRAFVRDRCVQETGVEVSVDDLYGAWQQWCLEWGTEPGSKQMFGRDLHAAVPHVGVRHPRVEGGRQRVYAGIGLARYGTR
jgi:putative DNA primase/helicase